MMLHKSKSNRTAMWKYGFSAPLFAGMLIFSAATASQENSMLAEEARKLIEPVNNILAEAPASVIASSPRSANVIETQLPPVDTIKESKRYALDEVVIHSGERPLNGLDVLKKHLQRNLKYPLLAREEKTSGLVVAKFTVKDKRIVKEEIQHKESEVLSAEVLRAMKTFTDQIDLPDNTYAMSFVFQIAGEDAAFVDEVNFEKLPNHKGTVVIVGTASSPKSVKQNNSSDVKNFASVEVLPEFPGGTKGWADYLKANLKYPEIAKTNNISGRVIVRFIVEKDGSLTDIKVLRGIGGGADEEAVRILTNAPKWRPGIMNGESVRVEYTMPIFFQLAKPAEESKQN